MSRPVIERKTVSPHKAHNVQISFKDSGGSWVFDKVVYIEEYNFSNAIIYGFKLFIFNFYNDFFLQR